MTSVHQDLDQDLDRHAGSADDAPSEPADDGGSGRDALPPTGGRRRRFGRRGPIDKSLVIVSLVMGLGLFLVLRGLAVGISGDDRVPLPELIEKVDPVPEAVQVPNQTRVFVDLETGYTGVLVIDGVEIETVSIDELAKEQDLGPGEQIDLPPATVYAPGNNTLTFVPNEDAPITEFETGEHRAQVIYWEEEVGRQRAKSFSWTFNVV